MGREGGEDFNDSLLLLVAHDDGVRIPPRQEKPREAEAAEWLPSENEGVGDGFFLVEGPRDEEFPFAADGVGQFLELALFALHKPDGQISLLGRQRDANLLLYLIAVQDGVAHPAVEHAFHARLSTCGDNRSEHCDDTDDALHPETSEMESAHPTTNIL